MAARKKFKLNKHNLIPKHLKVSDKEKKDLLDKYNISVNELPKIAKNDAAISHLDVKSGDVIKIIRTDRTAKESLFYRGVTNV